jgi:hypothetical protein
MAVPDVANAYSSYEIKILLALRIPISCFLPPSPLQSQAELTRFGQGVEKTAGDHS